MKKNKKTIENNQSKNSICWIDKILLNPQQYKKLNQYVAFLILLVLAGFVLLQLLSKNNAPYYWPIMGILIALAIGLIIFSFVFAFLKGSRFQKFNKQNFQSKLLSNYSLNEDVKEFKFLDDELEENIPAENLVCSKISKSFKFFQKSNVFELSFKDDLSSMKYVLALYKSSYKTALSTIEGNLRKVLVIKLKSINSKTFYIANQTLNFADPNYLDINFQKLALKGKTENYYIFSDENEEFDVKEMFDLTVLDQFLFNPNHLLQSYDLYNDKDHAYLIATVPVMFMNANLEVNESITDFEENLKKQAENDLVILKLLSNLKRIIEEDLSKKVIDLKNKSESSFSKINNPDIKIKESNIDSEK